MCVVVNGRRGEIPAFSVLGQCTMAESARPKAMTASTTAVHLKKLFTCSPPFELYFKDVSALISSRRLRVLSGVSPQASAARAVSQVRGGGGLSAPGSFYCPRPSFSFSFSSFDITILARLDFFCKWPAPFCFKCNIYNRPFLLCSLHKKGVIFALYFCTGFTNFKASQNFFKADYCTNFVYDCTNCQFLPLFTLYSF